MNTENYFVPKILLCGDKAEFFARIENRPYKIVGQIEFAGEDFNFLQDGKFSIDGKIFNKDALPEDLINLADYIIFNDLQRYGDLRNKLDEIYEKIPSVLTLTQFKAFPHDNFYDFVGDVLLINSLKNSNIKTLLDFDAHFAKGQVLTKHLNDFTEIDCICEKEILPIRENIYSHVYKNFSECGLKHYDAVLICAKSQQDFDQTFLLVRDSANMLIVFVRKNSPIANLIATNSACFANFRGVKSGNGYWILCDIRKPPEIFTSYVATHKKLPAELIENLPEGYKLIHSGRALSKDLGYIGDNTGDNISRLNPFINEVTAIYWMWKNTSDTIIGLAHYRRFFTLSDDEEFDANKILTREQAVEILKRYDIILNPQYHMFTVFENLIASAKSIENVAAARQIITKNLAKFQPDYVDAFNFVMDTKIFYKCNMFVTRRKVFDAYCKWFFSFYLDSVQEILTIIPLNEFEGGKKRLLGFFAEHILTTYFLRNRLRIKELNIMKVPDLKL